MTRRITERADEQKRRTVRSRRRRRNCSKRIEIPRQDRAKLKTHNKHEKI
jgi:hypothetical protein